MAFIEIQGVAKSFSVKGKIRHVLEDVNLTVERGEFISIVGFMGCGKSTFLNIAAGLQSADGGRVTIGGDHRPRRAARDGIRLPELLAVARG